MEKYVHTISFQLTYPFPEGVPIVRIQIDGQDFINMAASYERPFAYNIAGAYQGLWTEDFFTYIMQEGKTEDVPILSCTCGEIGCWSLEATITLEEDRVIWSDFHNPHRGEDSSGGHWDYGGFGPFVFERKQYEQAIKLACG
ncbi:hypothetical protein [Brevibacillus dissolubilis]|uniref:hypothetical protein n=1 Tax=Brevibacillus dissolubilis TaxID=1844116 RepID=UPI0011174CF1|nr:hypothetical protein [Brevibacillus dissolubilis]